MRRRLSSLAAAILVFIVAGMLDTVLGPTYQFLAQRFHMNLANVGMFTTLQFIGAVVGCVASGHLVSHLSVRQVYGSGLLLGVLGTALLFWSPLLAMAFTGVLVMGLALGVLNTAPILVISSLAGKDQAQQMNLLNGFFGIGAALTPAFVAVLTGLGKPGLVYLIVLGGCLAALIPARHENFRLQASQQGIQAGERLLPSLLGLAPFCLFLFLYVGVEVSVGSWLTVQVALGAGAGSVLGAASASLFWLGLTAGRFGGSLIMPRWQDERRLLAWSLSGLLAGIGLIVLGRGSLAFVGAILAGVGCGPIFPTTFAFAARWNSALRGQVAGLFMAGVVLGAAVLPYVQGRIGDGVSGGMEVSFSTVIFLCILFLGVLRRTGTVVAKPLVS
jgi:FHS family glucose/mannose:H+ symporter-like MFS transporter